MAPVSSVHRTFQARILEWVAMSYSRGIFLTQGSNSHLPHWQEDPYHCATCQEQMFQNLGRCSPGNPQPEKASQTHTHTLPPRASRKKKMPWDDQEALIVVAEGRRDPEGMGSPRPQRTTDHMLACCSGESRIQAQSLTSHGVWSPVIHWLWSPQCQSQEQRRAHKIWGQALTYWAHMAAPFPGGS